MMKIIEDQGVAAAFQKFPLNLRGSLMRLRALIHEVASEHKPVLVLQETLKWSEPAYLCKSGSTIRLGFPKSETDQYCMYFNCKSRLIDCIKEVYGDEFRYEGNRALVFTLNHTLNQAAVKQCIDLALTYHTRKHLTLLGM